VRSAKELGCHPAHELKVSDHQPGDPHQNVPERWRVAACGEEYTCASFLMNTGAPAHTECKEAARATARRPAATDAERKKLAARLKRASIQYVTDTTTCKSDRIRVTGKLVEGSAQIYVLRACGKTFRCLTLGAGSEIESPTTCEEMDDGKKPPTLR
jgi:hypothetical protein